MRTLEKIFLLGLIVLTVGGCGLLEKEMVVRAEDGTVIKELAARPGLELTIKFMHSVQKTPVEENLEFDGEGWIVRRTRYQSQGVGLPFMESDGEFRREGDWFVMDGMDRRIDRLSIRTGVGTRHSIVIDGEEIELYDRFEPGTRIDFIVD